ARRAHHHRYRPRQRTVMTITSLGPGTPPAARLRPSDLAGLASIGLRTRKLRAGLSALGSAIGVAAIVAVLGLAASSHPPPLPPSHRCWPRSGRWAPPCWPSPTGSPSPATPPSCQQRRRA